MSDFSGELDRLVASERLRVIQDHFDSKARDIEFERDREEDRRKADIRKLQLRATQEKIAEIIRDDVATAFEKLCILGAEPKTEIVIGHKSVSVVCDRCSGLFRKVRHSEEVPVIGKYWTIGGLQTGCTKVESPASYFKEVMVGGGTSYSISGNCLVLDSNGNLSCIRGQYSLREPIFNRAYLLSGISKLTVPELDDFAPPNIIDGTTFRNIEDSPPVVTVRESLRNIVRYEAAESARRVNPS